jgi:hypothetical protein
MEWTWLEIVVNNGIEWDIRKGETQQITLTLLSYLQKHLMFEGVSHDEQVETFPVGI